MAPSSTGRLHFTIPSASSLHYKNRFSWWHLLAFNLVRKSRADIDIIGIEVLIYCMFLEPPMTFQTDTSQPENSQPIEQDSQIIKKPRRLSLNGPDHAVKGKTKKNAVQVNIAVTINHSLPHQDISHSSGTSPLRPYVSYHTSCTIAQYSIFVRCHCTPVGESNILILDYQVQLSFMG